MKTTTPTMDSNDEEIQKILQGAKAETRNKNNPPAQPVEEMDRQMFQLPKQLKKDLKTRCAQKDITISNWLTQLIQEALDREGFGEK